ncbi:DNA replication and repair protein RecF [Patescibacteria group bacterium]|nr:DNA replication and repair protein RecF [Patescibacteria group bacterium]MBU1868060.1 DNA replication and repair protein RecF [Patescibacteria group bacterium]
MQLNALRLHNFRNFGTFVANFDSKITVLVGPNGTGKSNLLEAIHLLSSGNSFRPGGSRYLVRFGETKAVVEGGISDSQGLKVKISMVLQRSSKQYLVNGKVSDQEDFLSRFQGVAFLPRHLNIITGNPGLRRKLLDDVLSGVSFAYLATLSRYRQVLRQRNRLLSRRNFRGAEMVYWNEELANLGAGILVERRKLVAGFNKLLRSLRMRLDYYPSPRVIGRELGLESEWNPLTVAKYIIQKLEQTAERERELGFTIIGPQRDDLKVMGQMDQTGELRDLSLYGSRGQQRLAVVHLKSAQLSWLESELGARPALLLDDVFSELDSLARAELIPLFSKQQTIVTALEVPDGLKDSTVIQLARE